MAAAASVVGSGTFWGGLTQTQGGTTCGTFGGGGGGVNGGGDTGGIANGTFGEITTGVMSIGLIRIGTIAGGFVIVIGPSDASGSGGKKA